MSVLRTLLILLLVPATSASAQRLIEPPDGLTEVSREVDIELRYGLALVTTRVMLSSTEGPREAQVRIPVPPSAVLVALRVCSAGVCRKVAPNHPVERTWSVASTTSAPFARARIRRRPYADPLAIAPLVIHAAPVTPGHPYEIVARYVARAPLHRGTVSFDLPAQSGEEGDGATSVRMSAPDLEQPTLNGGTGPVELAPGDTAAGVRARLPEGVARAYAWSVRCGGFHCVRYRVAAGPVPPRPRDVFVLLDASPSTRRVPAERRHGALSALLQGLHPQSRVVRVAYARRASRLDAEPLAPGSVPVDEELPDLGNRTAFDHAWALFRADLDHAIDPLVVLIGDGALSHDSATQRALHELSDSRAEVSLVSIAALPTEPALAAVIAQTSGSSIRSFEASPNPAIRLLATPRVEADVRVGGRSHGSLRAGEEMVFERRVREGRIEPFRAFGRTIVAMPPRRPWADGLTLRISWIGRTLEAAATDQLGDVRSLGRSSSTRSRRRLVVRRPRRGRGIGRFPRVRHEVPRESFRLMRSRLRPAVTRCFGSARAGRSAWSAHATLRVVLHYGELVSATVPRSSDPALATCLAQVADDYSDLPFSDGRVAANFGFRSVPVVATPAEPPSRALRRALSDIGIRGGAAPEEQRDAEHADEGAEDVRDEVTDVGVAPAEDL